MLEAELGGLTGEARDKRRAWLTANPRAGLLRMLRHDFRRTAVRNMERQGVPRSHAMKLTGHRTEHVYARYAIVSDADLKAAAERLAVITTGITGTGSVESRSLTPRRSKEKAV